MNNIKYAKELSYLLLANNLNFRLTPDWYAGWIKKFEQIKQSTDAIKHPKKRGDIREKEFEFFLSKLLPDRYGLAKGFGVNKWTTTSKEQDIIIYDKNISPFIVDESECKYIPHNGIVSSIEVKSNLTKSELKKIALNCVSIKKLRYDGGFEFKTQVNCPIFYSIFCYDSSINIEDTLKTTKEISKNIPSTLQIDLLYILGKGLICKPSKIGIILKTDDLFDHKETFISVGNLAPNSICDDYANKFGVIPFQFIFFIFSIIEKCTSFYLKKPDYLADIFAQVIYTQQIIETGTLVDDIKFDIKRNVLEAKDKTLVEYLCYDGFTTICNKCNEKQTIILKKDYEDIAAKGIHIESFPFVCISTPQEKFSCCHCGATCHLTGLEEEKEELKICPSSFFV